MIIDTHTHIFPDKIASKTVEALATKSSTLPYSDGTEKGLLLAMERAGVDISLALPVLTKPTQFDSITAFALGVNERYKDEKRRIISFGGIHPDCDDVYAKLVYLKENGVKGIKIHPDYQGTFIDDERFIRIISIAKELDLIVVTHAGVDVGFLDMPVRCTPERAKKVIKATGHKKLVFAHYGGYLMWKEVLDTLCVEDVYFDTGYTFNSIDDNTFKEILARHGDDKILFATDSPWQDLKTCVDKVKSLNLGEVTEQKIFYKNAIKLLGE